METRDKQTVEEADRKYAIDLFDGLRVGGLGLEYSDERISTLSEQVKEVEERYSEDEELELQEPTLFW